MTLQIGDKVGYVPDMVHALQRDSRGKRPWVIGRAGKITIIGKGPEKVRQTEIEELNGKELETFLRGIRRAPDPVAARKKLRFINPREVWPGIVTAVNEDGTVNIDTYRPSMPTATWHYRNLKMDPKKSIPHTVHSAEAAAEEFIDPTVPKLIASSGE
jgi:hypothetical protein